MKFWIMQILVWIFGKHIVRLVLKVISKPLWIALEFVNNLDVNAQLSDDIEGCYSEQLSGAIAEDWLDGLDNLEEDN